VRNVEPAGAAHATATGLDNRKVLMWTFLASECMFFGTLISTYLIYRGRSVSGPTPHEILNIPVTSISTFVLLMSSLMMVLALSAIQRGNMRQFRLFIGLTALLGLTFLGFQVYEFSTFSNEGLTLQTNLFGSTFFTLTGFHGAHVSVGVIWLLSLLGFSFLGRMGPEDALRVEIAGIYWHFVDIVWIVIFTVVYLVTNY
jgi:heme/copper-type cytochrome/quinol oxidase subunit 3